MTNGRLPAIDLWPDRDPADLRCDPGDPPRLTPFLCESDSPSAAVVVCPGGGYARRAEHESAPVCRWLNTMGLSAFLCDYRVKPAHYSHPLKDLARAVRIVRHRCGQWHVDPGRIGVLGFSAGGHLAGSLAVFHDQPETAGDAGDPEIGSVSARPDLAILCYPVISFGPAGHKGSAQILLGTDPPEELRDRMSLENHVSSGTPPMFLWHTSDDPAVSVDNSLLMASALRRCHVPFALHVYPRGAHGVGITKDPAVCPRWMAACRDWLGEQGFLP